MASHVDGGSLRVGLKGVLDVFLFANTRLSGWSELGDPSQSDWSPTYIYINYIIYIYIYLLGGAQSVLGWKFRPFKPTIGKMVLGVF